MTKKKNQHYPPASEIEMVPKPKGWKPAKDWPKGHRHHGSGKPRCEMWSRRQGRQCFLTGAKGQPKCQMHGANKSTGLAHANTKTGEYSKHIERRRELLQIAQKYGVLDALDMRAELEQLRQWFWSIEERMREENETDYAWGRVRRAAKMFADAFDEDDSVVGAAMAGRAMSELNGAINAKGKEYRRRSEAMEILDKMQRMVGVQWRTMEGVLNTMRDEHLDRIAQLAIEYVPADKVDEFADKLRGLRPSRRPDTS